MAGGFTKVRKWNPTTKKYETKWMKSGAAAALPTFKRVNGKWVRNTTSKPVTTTPTVASTPAEEWATSAIQQKMDPLNEEAAATRANADQTIATSGTASAATTAELGKLKTEASGLTGEQLVNAAQSAAAAQGSNDTNLDFLRDVFGGSYADDVNVGQHTADSAKAQDAGVAAQLALGNQAQQRELGTYSAASTARHGDFTRQAQVARDRALEEIRRKGTAIEQERPLLERMFSNEDRDYMLKKMALDLDKKSLLTSDANQDADRAAAAAANADQLAAASKPKPGDAPPSARSKSVAAVGTLSDAVAKAQAALSSGEPDGVALASMRTNGLVQGRDYEVSGKKVKLTPTGAMRYFQSLAGMAPNHAFYAIKLYNPQLAAKFNLSNAGGKWTLALKPTGSPNTLRPAHGANSNL